jgi:hypothetical protein
MVSDETDAKREVPTKGIGLSNLIISIMLAFFTGFLTFAGFSFKRLKSLKTKIDSLVSVNKCLEERRKSGSLVKDYFDRIATYLSDLVSILDRANECKQDPDKLMVIIEASKQLITDLNTMIKEFSETIAAEGACFELRKDHK